MTSNGPIRIAYEGSADSRAATTSVAERFPGADVVVLYARQPLESIAAHLEGHPALEQLKNLDAATHDASAQIAADMEPSTPPTPASPPNRGCPQP